MKLYGSCMSPFVERVMITLEIKGQTDAVTLTDIPGGFKSPEHLAMSPMGRIPILGLDDGTNLAESQTIAEYLDTILDGPKANPEDPLERAHVSAFCRVVDLDFFAGFKNLWPGRASEDEVKTALGETLPKALDYLEHYAAAGNLLQAGKPTLADAALMPFVFHMRVFGRKLGAGDFGDRPTLSAWHKASGESDLGKASFARCSESLAKFSGS